MGDQTHVRAQHAAPSAAAPSAAAPSAAALLVIAAAVALLIALQPLDVLVRHLKDDSYYYFRTANHIALGNGPTFDGISLTNGFHPLWMLNLIPIYTTLPHAPLLALRVVVLLLAAYHTLTAWIVYRIARHVAGAAAAVIIALAWALCPFVLRISFSGMEAALYGVLLAALTWLVVARLKNAEGGWALADAPLQTVAGAGLLAGLCVLARLDAVYIVVGLAATLGAAMWRQRDARASVRVLLALVLPVTALVGPYLLYNWLTFGHLMPISGLIKRPVVPASPGELAALLLWPFSPLINRVGISTLLIALALLGALIIAALAASPPGRAVVLPVLRRNDWLWIGVALLYTHFSLSKSFIANWYYVPFALLLVLALGEIVARALHSLPSQRARRSSGAGIATLLFVAYAFIATAEFNPRKNDQVYATYQAALWLKANTPPNALGAAWNAGVLAYFSERQVMNLDGLINSYDYYDAMQRGEDATFAVQHGTRYVFDMFPVADGQATNFFPGQHWEPYLESFYEQRFQARNIGLSSFFQTVFLKPRSDATFVFKVWRVKEQRTKN